MIIIYGIAMLLAGDKLHRRLLMKRIIIFSIMMVFLLAFVSCDMEISDDEPNNANDSAVTYDPLTYQGVHNEATYKLTITRNPNRATFTPANGDTFVLVISGSISGTSTGTVLSFSNNTFSLRSSNETFTVTATSSGGITQINGTIPFTDGTTISGPGSLVQENNNYNEPSDDLLNGIWVHPSYSKFEFNDGIVIISNGGFLYSRGTYTTSDNIIIITQTHVHGSILNLVSYDGVSILDNPESKWYTRDELVALGCREDLLDMDLFSVVTSTMDYLVNGDSLSLTFDDGKTAIYTRRANVDSALNGTWVLPAAPGEPGGFLLQSEWMFWSGDVLIYFLIDDIPRPAFIGVYTTSGSDITMTITALHGDIYIYSNYEDLEYESKWYSGEDLKALGWTQEQVDVNLDTSTASYLISGDSLSWTFKSSNARTHIFTRKK